MAQDRPIVNLAGGKSNFNYGKQIGPFDTNPDFDTIKIRVAAILNLPLETQAVQGYENTTLPNIC